MSAPTTDGRLLRGEQTRQAILRRAADIASVDGLEGLSIGRLATELGVSKSGVFAHFGSKEELQIATVGAARDVFIAEVISPAFEHPPGLLRLWTLADGWLRFGERPAFEGGCFFCSVDAEFDARPGRVHDAIADNYRQWVALLERAVTDAQQLGEVAADEDPAQLAFELDAFARAANVAGRLEDLDEVYARARRAVVARLRAVAADPRALP